MENMVQILEKEPVPRRRQGIFQLEAPFTGKQLSIFTVKRD